MHKKILLVDDEKSLLEAYIRQLKSHFSIDTASSSEDALEMLDSQEYALVISDLRMPGMDGIELLAEIRERSPETVRILITGYADLETATEAINQGNIFRFLTKPCLPAVLITVINDAIKQHDLIVSEKELLEKTLASSVKVMTEILSIVNPNAFSRANRIIRVIDHVINILKPENAWEFKLAGMLSQIGWVTLPPEVLDKVYDNEYLEAGTAKMYEQHPKTAARLLSQIPRLERIAEMIKRQMEKNILSMDNDYNIRLGARLIQIAAEYDKAMMCGVSHNSFILRLKQQQGKENRMIAAALDSFVQIKKDLREAVKRLYLKDIRLGMILEENVLTLKDALLAVKGQEITHTVLLRMKNFQRSEGIREPLLMRILLTT